MPRRVVHSMVPSSLLNAFFLLFPEQRRLHFLLISGDVFTSQEVNAALCRAFQCISFSGTNVLHIKPIVSDIFTVYSPKNYPGSLPSTALSRLISDQGIRLRLRKELKRTKE